MDVRIVDDEFAFLDGARPRRPGCEDVFLPDGSAFQKAVRRAISNADSSRLPASKSDRFEPDSLKIITVCWRGAQNHAFCLHPLPVHFSSESFDDLAVFRFVRKPHL